MSCHVDDSRTYKVADCAVSCVDYKFFSLQDNGQCFCDNCLIDAIQYGVSTNCNGDGLGGSWANDIYENTECMKFP